MRWADANLGPDPWRHGTPEQADDVLTTDPTWGLPATTRRALEDRRHATARETQEGSQ